MIGCSTGVGGRAMGIYKNQDVNYYDVKNEIELVEGIYMQITKKHFEAVAKIISNHRYIGTMDSKRKLVNSFCDYFKEKSVEL